MWVSPFLRTRQTAEAIIQMLNPTVGKRFVHSVREASIIAERDWGYHEGNGNKYLGAGEKYWVLADGKAARTSSPSTAAATISSSVNVTQVTLRRSVKFEDFLIRYRMDAATLHRLNPESEEAVQRRFDDNKLRAFYRSPNGESLLDTAARTSAMCANIAADSELRKEGDRIRTAIVVTHGAAMRAFLSAWFRLPASVIQDYDAPGNCCAMLVDDTGARPLFAGYATPSGAKGQESAAQVPSVKAKGIVVLPGGEFKVELMDPIISAATATVTPPSVPTERRGGDVPLR